MRADRMVMDTYGAQHTIIVGLVTPNDAFNKGTLAKLAHLTQLLEDLTLPQRDDMDGLREFVDKLPTDLQRTFRETLSQGITRDSWDRLEPQLTEHVTGSGSEALERFLLEIGFRLYPFDEVISLTSVDAIEGKADELVVGSVMETVPRTEREMEALRRRALSDQLLRDTLVSRDASSLAVLAILSFNHPDWTDLAGEVTAAVRGTAHSLAGPERVFVSGVPVVNTLTSEAMKLDLARLVPFVVAVLALVLFAFFRRWGATLLPMTVVLVALVWTLGLMGLTGRPITLVTSSLPIMLLAIGIADGIHIMTHYSARLADGLARRQALLRTVDELAGPVFMTTLTTAAGFGSLATSQLPSIRDFGLFTAFGTMVALVATVLILPALIQITSVHATPPQGQKNGASMLGRLAVRGGRICYRHARPVLVISLVLVSITAVLAIRLKVGSKMTGNFREDTEIFRAGEMLNRKFGGTQVLDIVLDTGEPGRAKDPSVLAWLKGLQANLETGRAVGKTHSLADLVRRMSLVLHDEDVAYDRLPHVIEEVSRADGTREQVSGQAQIGQYLFLYENAGGDELYDVVDFAYRRLRMVAQIRGDDHAVSRAAKERALIYIENKPPPGAVTFAGCANTCIYADDLIIPSQLRSLAIALGVVTLMLSVLFRSVRLGLVGAAPMVVTISLSFGSMWLLGVPLDAVTALIASIVLGIGVDYAIHLIVWYQRYRRNAMAQEAALVHALGHAGRPILLNAIAVGMGFLVLVGSSFFPVRVIGGFVAAALLLSAAGSLVLLPALLSTRFANKAFGGGFERPTQ
jgi:predicted RND superfamily exporter protein